MEFIAKILPIVQIVTSILLIVSVLLQQTGVSLGIGFGGGDSSSAVSTRRGLDKFLLKFTILLSIIFFVTSILALLVK